MLSRVSAIGILIILSVFFYASLSGAQSSPSTQFSLSIKKAELAIRAQKYDDALLSLNAALQIDPNSAYAHLLLGAVYEDLGKFEDALKSFHRGNLLTPEQPPIYESLGRVYLKLNNADQALEFANKAKTLDDSLPSIHILLGNCYARKKMLPEAIAAFQKADSLDPKSFASCLLADTLISDNNCSEAIRHLEQCVLYRPGLAYGHFSLGVCYSQTGRYADSINSYKKAVQYDSSRWTYYSNLGLAYLIVKDHHSALSSFIKASELNPKHAETHFDIGLCHSFLKNRDHAIRYFKNAIALDDTNGKYWFALGLAFADLNDKKNALDAVAKAVELDPRNVAGHYWLALQFEADKNITSAISELNKVVTIDPKHADANFKLGVVASLAGRNDEAYQRLKVSEEGFGMQGNRKMLAEIRFVIGSLLFQMGKDIHAIQTLESALDLFEKEKNTRGQAQTLGELGNIYNQLSYYNKALMNMRKAQSLYETDKNFDGVVRILGLQALTIGSIAFRTDDDYTEAIRLAKKAIKIAQEQQLDLTDNLLAAIVAEGSAYWNLDDRTQLKEYVREAAPILEKFQLPIGRFVADFMLGWAYEKLDQLDKAELHLGRAMQSLSEGKVKNLGAFVYAAYARLKERQGDRTEARRLYLLAINEHNDFRINVQTLGYKMAAGERSLMVYNEAISFLVSEKDYSGAFNLVERNKARAFLDLMGTRFSSSASADNKELDEERKLQFAMSKLEEQFTQLSNSSSRQNSEKIEAIKAELDDNRARYNQLIDRIKKERPELASLLTVNPSNLEEIQTLLDDNTTLLEYYISERRTFLWIVSKRDLSLVEVPIRQKDLKQKVNVFRDSISSLSSDYRSQAADLYDLLIRPALTHIKSNRIAIVPHSILHYLPFQALVDSKRTDPKDDRFLIQQYDLFYLPSASLLKFTTSKRKQKKDGILAFGNPDTAGKSIDLIYAAKEVESIKKIYPDALIFMGAAASKKKMKQFAHQYGIIHFASHAELNAQSPMLSSLKLSSENGEEGDLQLHEIFHMNLEQAGLIVLSACETGLGKLSTGDEVNSLSRGFIYAGSPSVVASLWKVSDESTATLMANFYTNLKSSNKAEALRMAQIELISGKTGENIVRDANEVLSRGRKIRKAQSFAVNGSHPFFWAPFVLIGDWQ